MPLTERLVRWLHPYLCQGPLARGLADGLRALVYDGRLLADVRLPSERALAAALGLSRATVTAAFDELRGEGLLRSRRGDGTRVRVPRVAATRPDDGSGARPDVVDLSAAALPACPAVQEALTWAASRLPVHLTGVGVYPAGLDGLREAVADRHTRRGLPTRAEQILITSGALHGWNMLLRTLTTPGDRVLVEQPTYPAVVDAALAHRTRAVPLPVGADGWDTSQLPAGRPPTLAHLTFDGQNPTGRLATRAERQAVLAALAGTTVLAVDETHTDFAHQAAVRPTVPAAGRTVVTLGSMSKSFWAGLRVGWIRAPEALVRQVSAVRTGLDLGPPVLDQLVALALLRRAEELLPARRRMVAARREALLDALDTMAPQWQYVPPDGGLSAWVHLGGTSSTELARHALSRHIRITPGTRFTVTGTHDRWTRLPFVLPPRDLARAVAGLVAAAEHTAKSRRRRRPGPDTAWAV